MRRGGLGLLIACALLAVGCDNVLAPSDLLGGPWRLAELREAGGASQVPAEPGRYTVEFREGGELSVRADCNTCFGSYTLDDGELTISPLGCTRVACPAGSLEFPFVTVLQGVSEAEVEGGELEIESSRGELQLVR